jgi:uncharacterized protein YdhG (YjbR/CyaY superfamily)
LTTSTTVEKTFEVNSIFLYFERDREIFEVHLLCSVKFTSTMDTTIPKTIDEYIERFPSEVQDMLVQLRAAIRQAAPEAEDVISYQMPAFKYHGIIVYFAAYKKHIGFYPTSSGISQFKQELTGYKSAKGSVQFPLDKPLPLDIISNIIRFKVMENEAKIRAKKASKKQ